MDRTGYGEHCSGSDGGDGGDGGDGSEISDDWRRPGVTRAESDAGRIDWALPRERMRVVASEVALLSVQRYRFPSGNESRQVSNKRDHGGNVQRVDSDGGCHRLVRGVVTSLRERYGVDASLSPCLAHSGDIVEREREEGGVIVSYLLSLSSHSALLGANSPHLFSSLLFSSLLFFFRPDGAWSFVHCRAHCTHRSWWRGSVARARRRGGRRRTRRMPGGEERSLGGCWKKALELSTLEQHRHRHRHQQQRRWEK